MEYMKRRFASARRNIRRGFMSCIKSCAHSRAMNESISGALRNTEIVCPFWAAWNNDLILGPKVYVYIQNIALILV